MTWIDFSTSEVPHKQGCTKCTKLKSQLDLISAFITENPCLKDVLTTFQHKFDVCKVDPAEKIISFVRMLPSRRAGTLFETVKQCPNNISFKKNIEPFPCLTLHSEKLCSPVKITFFLTNTWGKKHHLNLVRSSRGNVLVYVAERSLSNFFSEDPI